MSKRDLLNKAFNEIDNGYINDAMSYRAEKKERTGPRRALTVLGVAALVAAFAGLSLFLLKTAQKPSGKPEDTAGTALDEFPKAKYNELYDLGQSDKFADYVINTAYRPVDYGYYVYGDDDPVYSELGHAEIYMFDNPKEISAKAPDFQSFSRAAPLLGVDYIHITINTVNEKEYDTDEYPKENDLASYTYYTDLNQDSFTIKESEIISGAKEYSVLVNGGKCAVTMTYYDVNDGRRLPEEELFSIIKSPIKFSVFKYAVSDIMQMTPFDKLLPRRLPDSYEVYYSTLSDKPLCERVKKQSIELCGQYYKKYLEGVHYSMKIVDNGDKVFTEAQINPVINNEKDIHLIEVSAEFGEEYGKYYDCYGEEVVVPDNENAELIMELAEKGQKGELGKHLDLWNIELFSYDPDFFSNEAATISYLNKHKDDIKLYKPDEVTMELVKSLSTENSFDIMMLCGDYVVEYSCKNNDKISLGYEEIYNFITSSDWFTSAIYYE